MLLPVQNPEESNKLFEGAMDAVSDLLVTILKKDVSSDNLDSIFKVSIICGLVDN